jgi:clan AA aspartic protease (TIGR02281 family)
MQRMALIVTTLAGLAAGTVCPADEVGIPIHEKRGTTFYVSGAIEGYGDTEFLIDTGASHLAIDERTLKSLQRGGHARYLRRLSGTLADGRRQAVPIYSISSIRIGENCVLREVEAAVLPGATRNILGLSVLRRTAPFTLSMDPPQLSLNGCEKPQA